MSDPFQVLQAAAAGPIDLPKAHAAKLGPFPVPVRISARAYSDHHQGGAGSTAWTKLYYDGALVGEADGRGDPISLSVFYDVVLDDGAGAAFRLDLGNSGSTLKDFGFEFTITPL